MKNKKNIWKITLSLFISGLLLFALGCSDDTTSPEDNDNGDIIYGDGVTDVDGNEYATVIIGNQEWMAENLRVTRYNNGDAIPTGLSDEDWEGNTAGAYAIYPHEGGPWDDGPIEGINSDAEMVEAYGKLYNWYAVDDARELCPEGWSVPSDDDWTHLVNYLMDEYDYHNDWESDDINGVGNALKSCRQVNSPEGGDCNTSEHPRWDSSSTHYGFDEFGFSALPGGGRYSYGGCHHLGEFGRWWSSTEHDYDSSRAYFRCIGRGHGDVYRNYGKKAHGFGLRCVRDH